MDDKLKQFIDAHRDEFDDIELPEGHQARFEKKLPSPRKRYTLWYSVYGVAAAACIALLIFFKPSTDLFIEEDNPTANVCEIDELQLYYTMQMNDVIARIEKIHEKDLSPGSNELMLAMKEVLNDSGHFEDEILPTLPCNEEGFFAMNQHYKNSLMSLQIMLEQMEIVTEIDNNEQHNTN